jgi:hypothetical protein
MRGLLKDIHASYMALKYSFRVCRILLSDQRYFASVKDGEYRDKRGNYVPWYTFPAIEALKNWDLSGKRIFEYGSGYSTLFWAARAREVVSVEHNPVWYEKISKLAPENARIILAPIIHNGSGPPGAPGLHEQCKRYAESIRDFGIFDAIIIDGYEGCLLRYDCARAARPQLSGEGLIILDNSDWLPVTARFLRESCLIEVDLSGPKPGRDYCQTTSFFFARGFDFQPVSDRQPVAPVGGKADNWETALE